MLAWTERQLADRERAFVEVGETMTTILAGGCLLGPEDLHTDHGTPTTFWVPVFELAAIDAAAFRQGDLIAIPAHVPVASCFAGARLRVVARSWSLVTHGRQLVWDLTLVCRDADPDETARRYRGGG